MHDSSRIDPHLVILLASGACVAEASRQTGIGRGTIAALLEDEGFRAEVARAREAYTAELVRQRAAVAGGAHIEIQAVGVAGGRR